MNKNEIIKQHCLEFTASQNYFAESKAASVMFHLMFVHYNFSSVWVNEWPPFGK